ARAALDALPPSTPVDEAAVATAQRALEDREHALATAEGTLRELQGKLALVGGAVVKDELREEQEALERWRDRERKEELDYAAARRLRDVLKEEDAKNTAHLGLQLAKPVTEHFQALTKGRYG